MRHIHGRRQKDGLLAVSRGLAAGLAALLAPLRALPQPLSTSPQVRRVRLLPCLVGRRAGRPALLVQLYLAAGRKSLSTAPCKVAVCGGQTFGRAEKPNAKGG